MSIRIVIYYPDIQLIRISVSALFQRTIYMPSLLKSLNPCVRKPTKRFVLFSKSKRFYGLDSGLEVLPDPGKHSQSTSLNYLR